MKQPKSMVEEKPEVLKFIATSAFRHAPNPPKYIYKQYVRRTKSPVQWDDFLRMIIQLEKEGSLQKSVGPQGEDCYFLLYPVQLKSKWYKIYESNKWKFWFVVIGILLTLAKIILG